MWVDARFPQTRQRQKVETALRQVVESYRRQLSALVEEATPTQGTFARIRDLVRHGGRPAARAPFAGGKMTGHWSVDFAPPEAEKKKKRENPK